MHVFCIYCGDLLLFREGGRSSFTTCEYICIYVFSKIIKNTIPPLRILLMPITSAKFWIVTNFNPVHVHFVYLPATGRYSCTSKRVCLRTFLTYTARLTVMIQIRYTRGCQLKKNCFKTYGIIYFHYPLNVCWDLVNARGEKEDKTLNKWTNVTSSLESKSYQGDKYLSVLYIVKRRI